MFTRLNEQYKDELACINNQYPFEPLKFSDKFLKLEFAEGCKLLEENGFKQNVNEDLDTINEKQLGKIIREKYGTDLYCLHKYPKSARPFYTMPDSKDDNFTNSYDTFLRGEEILSGAQRIHEYDLLYNKVVSMKINPDTLKDYLDAFK